MIRAIAVMLVVLGHCTLISSHYDQLSTYKYIPSYTPHSEALLRKYIYSFHMPLFFWISGFIHYYSTMECGKDFKLLNSINKKICRLLIPCFSTALFVLLPTVYLFGHHTKDVMQHLLGSILGFDITFHLWFLPTLFLIFLFFILSHKFIHNINWGFMCVALLLLHFSSNKFLLLKQPFYYAIYFYAGYINRKYKDYVDAFKSSYGFITFFLVHIILFSCSITDFLSIGQDEVSWAINSVINIFMAFSGIYYMYYLSKILSHYLRSCNIWKHIAAVDKASYVIYLFHVSIVYCILFLFAKAQATNSLLRITLGFSLGIILPYFIFHKLSQNTIFQFLFNGVYQKSNFKK